MSSAPRKTKSKGSKKVSSSSSTAVAGDKQSRVSRRRRKDVDEEFDGRLSERPESGDAEAWQAAEREARRRERGTARSRMQAEHVEQTYAAEEYERNEELRRALGDVSIHDGRGVHEERGVGEGEGEGEEEYTIEVWDALDTLEQLQPIVTSGPRWKLEEFLQAVDVLQEVVEILERGDCATGMRDAEALMTIAMEHLVDEFRDALGKNSKPLPASMLREIAMTNQAGRLVDPSLPRTSKELPSSSSSSIRTNTRTLSPNPHTASSFHSSASSSPSSSPSSSIASANTLSTATQMALQDWLSAAAVPFLHRMALKMVTAGEGQRCMEEYVKVRAEAVMRSVVDLDIRRIAAASLQGLTWQELERAMKGWIRDLRTVILVLLAGERSLCEEIFAGLEPDCDISYCSLMQASGIAGSLEAVMANGRTIVTNGRTAERLFALLDMFTAASDLRAQVESVSAVQGFQVVLSEMDALPRDIAAAVVDTFLDFQRLLEEPSAGAQAEKKSSSRRLTHFLSRSSATPNDSNGVEDADVASASIHPVTSYVVNYANIYLDRQGRRNYPSLLEYLLLEHAPAAAAAAGGGGGGGGKANGVPASGPQPPSSLTQLSSAPALSNSNSGSGSGGGSVFNFSLGSRSPLRSFPSSSSSPSSQPQEQDNPPSLSLSLSSSASITEHVTLSRLTSLLLESLMHSLEAKAARSAGTDRCVQALFLLNNAVHVAKNFSADGKGAAAADLPEWRDGQMVEKYIIRFQEAVLAKIGAILDEPMPTGGFLKSASAVENEVKNRLKRFNAAFEELAIKQAAWDIPDEERRKKTRHLVARRLKSMYSKFLLPFREELCEFKTYRYSPDAVERVVLDYFFLSTLSRNIPAIHFG